MISSWRIPNPKQRWKDTMGAAEKIADLKRIKVPIWSRWLGAYRAWIMRREALRKVHHIATLYHWTWWTDAKEFAKSWYILKEDGRGSRSFEFGSDNYLLRDNAKKTSLYASVVAPWVLGKFSNEQMRQCEKDRARQPSIPT